MDWLAWVAVLFVAFVWTLIGLAVWNLRREDRRRRDEQDSAP